MVSIQKKRKEKDENNYKWHGKENKIPRGTQNSSFHPKKLFHFSPSKSPRKLQNEVILSRVLILDVVAHISLGMLASG